MSNAPSFSDWNAPHLALDRCLLDSKIEYRTINITSLNPNYLVA